MNLNRVDLLLARVEPEGNDFVSTPMRGRAGYKSRCKSFYRELDHVCPAARTALRNFVWEKRRKKEKNGTFLSCSRLFVPAIVISWRWSTTRAGVFFRIE